MVLAENILTRVRWPWKVGQKLVNFAPHYIKVNQQKLVNIDPPNRKLTRNWLTLPHMKVNRKMVNIDNPQQIGYLTGHTGRARLNIIALSCWTHAYACACIRHGQRARARLADRARDCQKLYKWITYIYIYVIHLYIYIYCIDIIYWRMHGDMLRMLRSANYIYNMYH